MTDPDPPPIPPPPDNINILAPANYYSSLSGGACLYIANNYLNARSAEVGLMALINPPTSGKTLYIYRLHFGSVVNAIVKSYRDATLTGGASFTPINRTNWGGSSVANVLIATASSALNFTPTVPFSKTRGITGYADPPESVEDGTLQILPGHSILWTVNVITANRDAWNDIMWWEK